MHYFANFERDIFQGRWAKTISHNLRDEKKLLEGNLVSLYKKKKKKKIAHHFLPQHQNSIYQFAKHLPTKKSTTINIYKNKHCKKRLRIYLENKILVSYPTLKKYKYSIDRKNSNSN